MVVMRRIILLLFFVTICISPVYGIDDYSTSGTVEYQKQLSAGYVLAQTSASDTINPLWIQHRFTDAKFIYYVQSGDVAQYTAGSYSDTSTFDATVDGCYYGSGIAAIINIADQPTYRVTFTSHNESYAYSLTGQKRVVLSIDDMGIFDGISFPLGDSTNGLTADKPSNFELAAGNTYAGSGTYLAGFFTYYQNDYLYSYDSSLNNFNLFIDKLGYSSKIIVQNNTNGVYVQDSGYTTTNFSIYESYNNGVILAIGLDVDGGISLNTTIHSSSGSGESDFNYNIITELDEYSPGDIVNVTYSTDIAGSIQVVDVHTDEVFHSMSLSSGVTNGTWQYYISEVEDFGYFDVYLLDSDGTVLDSYRYTLLPQDALESYLHIVQSSVNLYDEIDINVQTANASIFTIVNPNGVEVWNDSTFGAQEFRGITYTPTVNPGVYTAYLYDDETLSDTVMVFPADAPIITDPVTNDTIIEDALEDDETMTEYFDGKFREFAPLAWGIFTLAVVLWLMAILSSFGSGCKRR